MTLRQRFLRTPPRILCTGDINLLGVLRGVVTVESKGVNQRGEEVCYFRRRVMVWKRDGAPVRQRPYSDDLWAE